MNEIWKAVVSNELYEVSSMGNVRRVGGRQLKPTLSYGYELVHLRGEKGRLHRVHRLVTTAFIPNPNNYPEVNHIDGNRRNNHLSNLEWVTKTMNMQHAARTGLQPVGTKCYNAKLNDDKVRQIRASNLSYSKLAAQFHVSRALIGIVKLGQTWKHVTP